MAVSLCEYKVPAEVFVWKTALPRGFLFQGLKHSDCRRLVGAQVSSPALNTTAWILHDMAGATGKIQKKDIREYVMKSRKGQDATAPSSKL